MIIKLLSWKNHMGLKKNYIRHNQKGVKAIRGRVFQEIVKKNPWVVWIHWRKPQNVNLWRLCINSMMKV